MIEQINRRWGTIDWIRWVKPLVVLAVVFLSFRLGRQPNFRQVELAAVLLIGILSLAVFTRWLEFGFLLLVPIALSFRFDLNTGTKIPFNALFLFVIFLLAVWLMRSLILDKQLKLNSSRVNFPAILFVFFAIISLIGSGTHWLPFAFEQASFFARLGAFLLYVLSIGVLIVAGNAIKDERWLVQTIRLFVVLGAAYMVLRLIPHGSAWAARLFIQDATGSMFWIWLVALSAGQFLWNDSIRKYERLFYGLAIIATFLVGLFSGREWVSGWLPPLIALVVILWLRAWRAGLATSLALALGVLTNIPRLYSLIFTDTQQYSAFSRTATWPILFELIKLNPLIGLGPANYYFYTPLYSLLGFHVSFNSHNNYLDILAQYGFLGLFSILWLFAAIGLTAWALFHKTNSNFRKGYAAACLGGLVAMLASGFLGDWFFPFIYNIGFPGFRSSTLAWLFLGGMLALAHKSDQLKEPA